MAAESKFIPELKGFYSADFAQGNYRFGRNSFWSAGQTSYIQPPAEDPDTFEQLYNILPITDGNIRTRWGYDAFGTAQTAAVRRMFMYYNESTDTRVILGVGAATNPFLFGVSETGTSVLSPYTLPSKAASASDVYCTVSRNYAYFIDGQTSDLLKWDGTTFTGWGIDAAATAVAVGTPTTGAVTLDSGRAYYAIFYNSTSGGTSDLNPVSASTGPITSQEIPISSIPTSSDSQVTHVILLATADGGDETTLYELAKLSIGTTTYTDNTTEDSLLLANVWQDTDQYGFEHGVAENTPPSGLTSSGFVIAHLGRLYICDGSTLYFSKSLDDVTTASGLITGRWEECWPGTNQMEISQEAEIGRALFSDGVALYIGTSRRIWRLTGDGPTTYSEPQVIYNDTGVVCQDVMCRVFAQGEPVGVMWLTPDNRVISSNFNTYQDVGRPIQDVLSAINAAAIQTSYATSVSIGPTSFYALAIPTGTATTPNTICVYDLNNKVWGIWNLYDSEINALFYDIPASGAPLFLFTDNTGGIWQFSSNFVTDRASSTAATIPITIRTTWQPLGENNLQKFINEFELDANNQNISVTLESANQSTDFAQPYPVVSNAAPTLSPFGTYKIYTAAANSSARYYRATITANWQLPTRIAGWNFDVVPINRF